MSISSLLSNDLILKSLADAVSGSSYSEFTQFSSINDSIYSTTELTKVHTYSSFTFGPSVSVPINFTNPLLTYSSLVKCSVIATYGTTIPFSVNTTTNPYTGGVTIAVHNLSTGVLAGPITFLIEIINP